MERKELFDKIALKKIVDNWDLLQGKFKEDRIIRGKTYKPKKIFESYLATSSDIDANIGENKVQYVYSRFHKIDKQGRLFAKGARGMQSFKKTVRNTINVNLYREYDIVNCHPNLLVQYCEKKGIDCAIVKNYVEHRDTILADIMQSENMMRDEAKEIILSMINGGKCLVNNKWIRGFQIGMSFLLLDIINHEENKELYAKIKKTPRWDGSMKNPEGRTSNHILCRIENEILQVIIESLEEMGISTEHMILEFDGFEIPKKVFNPNDEALTDFFQTLQDKVFEKTGYKIVLTEKFKVDLIDLSKYECLESTTGHIDPSVFKTMIITVDKKTGKGKNETTIPVQMYDADQIVNYLNKYLIYIYEADNMLIELSDQIKEGYHLRKIKGKGNDLFCANWGPKLCDITPFEIWLKSEQRRQVLHIDYVPYLKTPPLLPEAFNTFRGFKHKFIENFKVKMDLINPILNIIREIWANGVEEHSEYVINWLAHKVQHPEKKIGVSLVVRSELQGTGKGTVFTAISKHVLGEEYAMETSDFNTINRNFNSHMERTLFVCCDEISSRGAMFKAAGQLKQMITRTVQNVEKKGVDVRRNAKDYNDYVFYSNNGEFIMNIEPADRRNFCLEASNIRAGDHEYWDTVYKSMNDEMGLHLFHYLATKDLTGFKPQKIPTTEWKRELKEHNIREPVKAMMRLIKSRYNKETKQYDETETCFHIREFMEFYEVKEGDRVTSSSLSKDLCRLLSRTPAQNAFTKHVYGSKTKYKQRGFIMTLKQLKEDVFRILQDKDIDFTKFEETDDNYGDEKIEPESDIVTETQ